jgi:hypothetical protein
VAIKPGGLSIAAAIAAIALSCAAVKQVSEKIKELLLIGKCGREIARELHVSPMTVRVIKRDLIVPNCRCGQPHGHKGWCAVRLARCPRRRDYILRVLPERNRTHTVKGRRQSEQHRNARVNGLIGIPKKADPETIALCKRRPLWLRRLDQRDRLEIAQPSVRLDRRFDRTEIHEILNQLVWHEPNPYEALIAKEEWQEERKYWLWERWQRKISEAF